MSNSEESRPQKKRKMEESPSSSFRLSSLPDDIALNCIALTSKSDRAALSLTSKRYRSLVASSDLYKMRSLMGRTETDIYVCLGIYPLHHWYILRRRNASSCSDLIPIPGLPSEPRVGRIYAVDGRERTFYYSPSEGKWGRGKGGHLIGNRRDWCMIDNLIYCVSKKGRVYWYEPKDLDWPEGEGEDEPEGMFSHEVKGLDSLRLKLSNSYLVNFDKHSVAQWEQSKNIFSSCRRRAQTRLIDLLPGSRLTNSGPNIVLFWDVTLGLHGLELWCAEISLKRL
ncbi:PREDICTED: putative F-box/kelch-repeat protein At3g24610 [Camelina sativa]|uniref:F-box/kelch-repeat protein At3g24610 n=1 Tax=Camelina sativa TaxID=90675 RepID=A0ABM0TT06_CAMSA|nr:PREDICTED: putative F-box/kelch-repeat protein At3g24610 [Camelina sativa]